MCFIYLLTQTYSLYICNVNPIKTYLCSPTNLTLLPFSGEMPKNWTKHRIRTDSNGFGVAGLSLWAGGVHTRNPWPNCLVEAEEPTRA